MGNVNVSREGLQKIKTGLSDFQTEIKTNIEHIKSHAAEVVLEVHKSIKAQHGIVIDKEKIIQKLEAEIDQYESHIISNNKKVSCIGDDIEHNRVEITNLYDRISGLETQKRSLMLDKNEQSNRQLREIEQRIQSYRRRITDLNAQVTAMQSEKNETEEQTLKLKQEKSRTEINLEKEKHKLAREKDKYARLKSAGSAVETETSDLLIFAQKFKQSALSSTDSNMSGIDKCKNMIDEYLMTDVGGTGSSDGGLW